MGLQSILKQDILAGDRRFEQKDYQIQSKLSRAPHQEELKTPHKGRRNPERHLIKTKFQDNRLDDLDDKDFGKQTIIQQAQKAYDDQRSEKPNIKRILDYLKPSG